jgi:acyl-CoA hydrolase
METYTLVRPEHLNHYGKLFGGELLKWIDETAWLAAARDFPGSSFVTVAMDEITFKQQVENGAILRFDINAVRQGNSSVQYEVHVFGDFPGAIEEVEVFSTKVTFVNVDKNGKAVRLEKRLDI